MPTLHVVIPIYNEPDTLEACLQRVAAAELPEGWSRRLVLIDDHSDDPCSRLAQTQADRVRADGHDVLLRRHEANRGKGAALQTGFDLILQGHHDENDLVIIQDADLEYDPADYRALMQPILAGEADAVLGNRWGKPDGPVGSTRRAHTWGNRLLTSLSNRMTGLRVSDMECCYKILPVSLLRRVRPLLQERRFGIEPQMVAALARLGARVRERPVHYAPRGFAAGKKIGWTDAVRAIWVILRERLRPAAGPTTSGTEPDDG